MQHLVFRFLFVVVLFCDSFGQTQVTWIPLGPYGGDLGRLAVDPFSSVHAVVFASTGTPYVTNDGGDHWQTLGWSGIKEFQFDPVNRHGSYAISVDKSTSPPKYQFLRSTDEGVSWSARLQGNAVLSGLRVASTRDSRIFLIREFQTAYSDDSVEVLCSSNQGESWQPIYRRTDSVTYSNGPRFVVPFPGDTLRFLLVKQSGVDTTSDGGKTWHSIDSVFLNGVRFTMRGVGVRDMVIHPQRPSLWFARISFWGTAGLLRSTDGGAHWVLLPDVPIAGENGPITDPPIPSKCTSLLLHPLHPDTMFIASSAGTTFLYRSTDAGESWSRSTDSLTIDEVQDLAFVDDERGMLLSTRNGVGLYRITADSLRFVPSSRGINLLPFYSVNAPAGLEGSIIATGKASGTFVSKDGGMTWQMRQHGLLMQSITRLVVHPLVPEIQYAIRDMVIPANNCFRTRDGGLSWSTFGAIGDIDVSPNDTLILFRFVGAPYQGRIEKSTDGGNTWIPKLSESFLNPGTLIFAQSRRVVTHKVDPKSIFAVILREVQNVSLPCVFRSTDGGEKWDSLGLSLGYARVVHGLWFDPESPMRVYLSYEGGLLISTDNGSSWSSLSNPTLGRQSLDVLDLVIAPRQNTHLYAATYCGVFQSSDGGHSWGVVGDSTADFSVSSLALDRNGVLFAATSNYGIYKTSSPVTTIDDDIVRKPTTFCLHQNYPNPFNPTTNFQFRIANLEFVSLKIYDVLGREVAVLVNEVTSPGTHKVLWDASSFPSGVYFYRLQARQTTGGQAGSVSETKKLVLIR